MTASEMVAGGTETPGGMGTPDRPIVWPGPKTLADVIAADPQVSLPRAHERVYRADQLTRASTAEFAWYCAATGPDPERNARIAQGLRWVGGSVVTATDAPLIRWVCTPEKGFSDWMEIYPVRPGSLLLWVAKYTFGRGER